MPHLLLFHYFTIEDILSTPTHWVQVPQGSRYLEVELERGNPDYERVAKEFIKSVNRPRQIIKVFAY